MHHIISIRQQLLFCCIRETGFSFNTHCRWMEQLATNNESQQSLNTFKIIIIVVDRRSLVQIASIYVEMVWRGIRRRVSWVSALTTQKNTQTSFLSTCCDPRLNESSDCGSLDCFDLQIATYFPSHGFKVQAMIPTRVSSCSLTQKIKNPKNRTQREKKSPKFTSFPLRFVSHFVHKVLFSVCLLLLACFRWTGNVDKEDGCSFIVSPLIENS